METNGEVELTEKFQPVNLVTGEQLSSGEILKVFVVCHHINWSQRSFEVVVPYLKGFENGEQFFVMDMVVEFGGCKGVGVESNGVDFIVCQGYHGEDGSEGIV